MTDLGALDTLGAIEGGLGYEALVPFAIALELGGCTIMVLRLAKLIDLKERSTREKDRIALAQMKATLKLRGEDE
jgi:hypothetical protein